MAVNLQSVAIVVLIAAFAAWIRRFASLKRQADVFAPPGRLAARGRAQGWAFLIFGAIGLTASGILFTLADADLRAYSDSASCKAGLVLAAPLDGTCVVTSGLITNAYRTSGKSPATHVVIAFSDGHTENVIESHVLSGAVMAGFRDANDRYATIQQFRGHAVLVQTHSGSFETASMPLQRVNEWGVFGIISGIFGLVGALVVAFR